MQPGGADHNDPPVARSTRAAAEVLLLGLVAFAAWPFGCTTPRWNLVLALGVFALVSLWAAHAVITRRFSYTSDPVSICLLGLVLLTAAQLVPLPESVVRILSPTAAEWHHTLIPDSPDLLPGETEADVPGQSGWLRLSVAPSATEDLLARLLAVFLVYAAARNFVADRDSFRRLAWVGFATGFGLAFLGLAQYLSGARTLIYWRVEGGAPIFGPFANKNHFAFQVNLFAGLTGGLFLWLVRKEGGWRTPIALAVLGGLGLMAVSVAFSQSRGGVVAGLAAAAFVGVLAWSVRGRGETHGARAGLVMAIGVGVIASLLTAWFGWRGAADRISTLWGGEADNRTTDWFSVLPLVKQFPAIGVGGGGLARAEPMVRTRSNLTYEFNTLDNEYLEALVEGGIPRLALTVALAIAAVSTAAAGYRRNPERSHAPLLLGCAFGLAAVAFQSAGDFGLHTPSVALTAAVITAFAEFGRQESGNRRRVARVRIRVSGDRNPETDDERQEAGDRRPETGDNGQKTGRGNFLTGQWADAATALLVLAGLLVVVADWRAYRVDGFRKTSAAVLRSRSPSRFDDAIRYLEAAAKVRPNDPAVWDDLAAVHLLAAAEQQQTAFAAVAGPVVFVSPPEVPPSNDPDGHIAAALKAARASRDNQPLGRSPHLTLGTLADGFARSEPPAAHFDRAKRVAGFDPDVWYTSGRAAANRGDWSGAMTDWRESLARSPKRVEPIIRRAATHFPPAELRTRLLPDDPAAWFAATRFVFPHTDDPQRRTWLKATADRWAGGTEPQTVARFAGWATVLEELGEEAAAVRVWRRAVEKFPEETLPHDRLALRLEADELYEEAVPELEWLLAHHPDHDEYRNRLEATHHALKLKAVINRP